MKASAIHQGVMGPPSDLESREATDILAEQDTDPINRSLWLSHPLTRQLLSWIDEQKEAYAGSAMAEASFPTGKDGFRHNDKIFADLVKAQTFKLVKDQIYATD